MTENSDDSSLAILRRQIDSIDDQIADLIVERMAVVDNIRAFKQRQSSETGTAMRPGREAQVVRRIVGRIGAAMSAPAIIRIWREIISAATRAQTPFCVHIGDQRDGARHEVLARAHFGMLAPVKSHDGDRSALEAAAASASDIAVLPLRPAGQPPWWVHAGEGPDAQVHIFALLDDGADGSLYGVVGAVTPETSGDDLTLLICEGDEAVTSDGLLAALKAQGFEGVTIASYAPDGDPPMALVQIDGAVGLDDERLSGPPRDQRLKRVFRAGMAARPFANKGKSR